MPRPLSAATLAAPPTVATRAQLLAPLSRALDLAEGQPPGWSTGASSARPPSASPGGTATPARRGGVRLAGLADRADHYRRYPPELIALRAACGAAAVRQMGLPSAVGEVISTLDEHWDSRGYPERLAGDSIPLLSRVLCLAQTLKALTAAYGWPAAVAAALQRSGTWFDLELVRAVAALPLPAAAPPPPPCEALPAPGQFDRICAAFADLVEAKSLYTPGHSRGAAAAAVRIGAAPGCCTIWASLACLTPSSKNAGHSRIRSGPSCAATRSTPTRVSAVFPASVNWRRSPPSTTNGWTARATGAVWRTRNFRCQPAF